LPAASSACSTQAVGKATHNSVAPPRASQGAAARPAAAHLDPHPCPRCR
jgi:hypothetical protein